MCNALILSLKVAVLMCTLMDTYRYTQERHSINFFSSHIDNYTFRIGSRIFHRVDNSQPALSYVNTFVSMNRFNRNKANTITGKNYNRERNVHVFNFERVIGKLLNLKSDNTNARLRKGI